jgi:hypothetical protein
LPNGHYQDVISHRPYTAGTPLTLEPFQYLWLENSVAQ